MNLKKIRVLIVDDSPLIRNLLNHVLTSDSGIEVVGVASDPYAARDKLVELKPDLMTLDIEMPRMDGITFLEKVMQYFPTRTVIVSSLTAANSSLGVKALELGAVDVIDKQTIDNAQAQGGQAAHDFIERIKAAGRARLQPGNVRTLRRGPIVRAATSLATTHQILAIASSTGGTRALNEILPNLPPNLPPTVIVQHMPALFTKAYAKHLQEICQFEVKEAEEGDKLIAGRVLIAPGDYHMEIERVGKSDHIRLHQEPELHGVRPAADYLMKSVAKYAGANAIGVILTGMGRDGAEGLAEMRKAGAFTVAQDEQTSVVYGMPKAAVELGAVEVEAPLQTISALLTRRFRAAA